MSSLALSDPLPPVTRPVRLRDINWTRGRLEYLVCDALAAFTAPDDARLARDVAARVERAFRAYCVERGAPLAEITDADRQRLRSVIGRILLKLSRHPRSPVQRVQIGDRMGYWMLADGRSRGDA